jgi:hypothetical protein
MLSHFRRSIRHTPGTPTGQGNYTSVKGKNDMSSPGRGSTGAEPAPTRRSRLGALKDLRSRLDSSIAESIRIRADIDRVIGVDEMSSRSGRPGPPSVSPGPQCRALVGEEPDD